MKSKLMVLLLGCAVSAFAQHGGGGGHAGGGMGPGGGMGAPTAGHGGNGTGRSGDAGRSTGNLGKQSPDNVLSHNTHLASKLDKMLPNGMTAQQACSGFKNLGQCVAAIHVSHNLGIPFDQLKGRMTGSGSESLGKSIHDLKPGADAKAEAKRGEKEAEDDLREG